VLEFDLYCRHVRQVGVDTHVYDLSDSSQRKEVNLVRTRVSNSNREYLFNIRIDEMLIPSLEPSVTLPQTGILEFESVVLSSDKQSSESLVSTDFSMSLKHPEDLKLLNALRHRAISDDDEFWKSVYIDRRRVAASKIITSKWSWPKMGNVVMFTHSSFSKKTRLVSETQIECLIRNATSDRETALLVRALCGDENEEIYLSLNQAERILNLFEGQQEPSALMAVLTKCLRCPHLAVKLFMSRRDRVESQIRSVMLRSLLWSLGGNRTHANVV